jgi:hypothetical protein
MGAPDKSEHAMPGLPKVAAFDADPHATVSDYAAASAEYIRCASELTPSEAKTAQLALSKGLSRVVVTDLEATGIPFRDLHAGEREVGGGLRTVKADVSEMTARDGLTVAVEIKPVHLAVGRAIWNRVGDIRTFALNIHLKFPFAVVGGVLTIPTSERKTSGSDANWKSTLPAVEKAIKKFHAAGERRNEHDATHLLEAAAVVVFDIDSGELRDDLPGITSELLWGNYINTLSATYDLRFND